MYQISKRQTRLSTDVEFFNMNTKQLVPEETRLYFYETYKATGKCLYASRTLSDDGLTENLMFIWESKDVYLESLNDPVLANTYAEQAAYNTANGILKETLSEEEI